MHTSKQSNTTPIKKRIVIVGGGIAGTKLAQILLTSPKRPSYLQFSLTLISPVNYSDFSWAIFRSISNPSFANQQVLPYKSIFQNHENFTHIQGKATQITSHSIVTDTNLQISYDVLILATGSKYTGNDFTTKLKSETAPTVSSRIGEIKNLASKIASAKRVLIVGTGMSGVEAAGEIAYHHPDVKVTLVNRSDGVVKMMPPHIQDTVQQFLKSFPNIELKFNIHVSNSKDIPNELESDVVLWTIGLQPNTEFLKKGILQHKTDSNGFVLVDVDRKTQTTSFQIQDHPNIFAMGDIVSPALVEEPFMSAYLSMESASHIAKNVWNVCCDHPVKKTWKKQKGGGAIVCSPKHACAYMNGITIPQFLIRWMKGKDLFCGKMQSEFGVKIPVESKKV